ncbi:hypothetical protein [Pseudomonas sp. Marseille-Q1929]|uniref:hypothetical protein n=1 Tax=Pseudomonas sp. Marseille-Q1929 TaxID=2730402 RepID=UPI001A8DDF94|nr:hypothetical protein [Pseudomonas sp. Marseille-Q1929]MBO0493973.1 hypothetical protein [Pseudomonas sp. Marseille-Q1929]
MSLMHALNRSIVTQLAQDLSSCIETTIIQLNKTITDDQAAIEGIDALKLRNAPFERMQALKPTQDKLDECQSGVDDLAKKHYGFGWLVNRRNTTDAKELRNSALADHKQAVAHWDANEASLKTQIAQHNTNVRAKKQTRDPKQLLLDESKQQLKVLEAFKLASARALASASGAAWLSAEFPAVLSDIDACVRKHEIADATALLGTLVFQQRPTDEEYAGLQQQAQAIRDLAYAKHYGVPVTGGYPEIVAACAKLAAANMVADSAIELLSSTQPVEQWQMLTQMLTSPLTLSIDVLWTIYWAMLQCEDEMAKFLSGTVAKEDPLNGRFSVYVEKWLADWAGQKIPAFGYPTSQSYFGALQLAGTPEESRVGADLGVIISLNVGGLVCRKAVLLQAKRAKDWVADIGSQKGQLTTLSSLQDAGYYLFYHESPGFKLDAPVPTVSSAPALRQLLIDKGRSTTSTKMALDVRTCGWDWASFITFGLCDPTSGVGRSFDTIDQAMNILGSGKKGELPIHLYVVAIEDEPYVRELKKQVLERYESDQALEKKEPKQEKENNGHEPDYDF